jgi:hypothetical protein
MEQGGAKTEYRLVHVPLDERVLEEFRSGMDTPNVKRTALRRFHGFATTSTKNRAGSFGGHSR